MLWSFIYFFLLVKNTAWQHGVQAVQHPVATLSAHSCSTNSITVGNNKLLKKKLTLNKQWQHSVFAVWGFFFSIFKEKHTADGSNIKYRPINNLQHRHPMAIYETLIKKQLQRMSNGYSIIFYEKLQPANSSKTKYRPIDNYHFHQTVPNLEQKNSSFT